MSAARRGPEAVDTLARHAREGGHPVRRGLSAELLTSLEYWIVRPSAQLRTRRTMIVKDGRSNKKRRHLAGVSI